MKPLSILAIVSFSVVTSCSTVNKDAPVVFITAKYIQGFSAEEPWELEILSDGKVEQFVWKSNKHGLRKITRAPLSPTDMNKLQQTIDTSDFFQLHNSYEAEWTDLTTRSITITKLVNNERKTHSVRVYGAETLILFEQTNNLVRDDVQRFLSVWDKLEELVPSPNVQLREQWRELREIINKRNQHTNEPSAKQ